MTEAPTMPGVHFIEAKIGPSIVTLATGPLPDTPLPIGLLYTLAFDEMPNFPTLIEVVSAALKQESLGEPDFHLPGGPLLTVEPKLTPDDLYKGLRCLQKLFQPRIPQTALAYETGSTEQWHIQLSVLGGFLAKPEIERIRAAIEASGASVTQILQSQKQQADVFAITVPARSNRSRRGFLHGLQERCGIFVAIQSQTY